MRRATKEDIPALVFLEAQLFPDNNLNETTLRNEFEIGECWVIEEEDEVVGYSLSRTVDGLTDLLRLGVKETSQSHGYGSQLLERVLLDHSPVMLTVRKDNERAMKLYFRYGFRIVGSLSDGGWVLRR